MTRKININQLVALRYLLEEKHVSRAANRACVSQPAMSKTLQSLREITGDPLLYRDGNDMKLTGYAKTILTKLTPALNQLDQVLVSNLFDESECSKEFSIASSDFFSTYALPEMLLELMTEAPKIKFKVLDWNQDRYKLLKSGQIDLATAKFLDTPNLPESIEKIKIGDDGLVCVMSKNHPLQGKQFSIQDYLNYPHICVSEITDLVDQCLYHVDYKNLIKFAVPYYSSAIQLAQSSNYLMTLPLNMAAKMHAHFNLDYTHLPFTSLKINYFLLWPKLKQAEDSHTWLRTKLLGMMKTDFEVAKSEGLLKLDGHENNQTHTPVPKLVTLA